ncbi:MAG: hypothetical protein K9I99_14575 [Melioribacteraceae bacterium]|nr:hypothetical protein [Melioribacteraceae bacterium]
MFNIEYINELISGQLSVSGYKHIVSVVFAYIKKYNWPKSIVISSNSDFSKYWTVEEIEEFVHQFFEWALTKDKFQYLHKLPENYLSYYFSQILVSFVANRIKEEQQKAGLSYDKCRELVTSISKENYTINVIDGVEYIYNKQFTAKDILADQEIELAISYLPKIPILNSTKHYKPLVKLAVEDILNAAATPISLKKMTDKVFQLFDQKGFTLPDANEESGIADNELIKLKNFDAVIARIVFNLSKNDAKILSEFLFNNDKNLSIGKMAEKFKMPKSTLHQKIDAFKKKLRANFIPENEEEGIIFIKQLAKVLDNSSK